MGVATVAKDNLERNLCNWHVMQGQKSLNTTAWCRHESWAVSCYQL